MMAFRFLAVLCVFGGTLPAANGLSVWIDTDPSIGLPFREVDDAFALILAFHSPEIRIVGISATYGNASLEADTRIAQDLVARFGKNAGTHSIPVFAGASSSTDLGRPTAATGGLATALRQERLTYLALGPLTDLATLIRLHPELAQRIDRVVVVGGQTSEETLRLGRGSWLPIHDANVFKDQAAMAEVLQSKCPITLAPVEVSLHLVLTTADLEKLRGTKTGEFLYRRSRQWSWFWRRILGFEGGPLFDVLAVLAVVRPETVVNERRYAEMNNSGRLIARPAPPNRKRPVTYISGIKPGITNFIRERLTME